MRRHVAALLASSLIIAVPASAQVTAPSASAAQAREPTARWLLVRQDSSDCMNSDVTAADPALVGGTLSLVGTPDGNTTVRIAITAQPNTTYHLHVKCSRHLGDFRTEDEGQGVATFVVPAGATAPPPYVFELSPDGAPAGGKLQSVPR